MLALASLVAGFAHARLAHGADDVVVRASRDGDVVRIEVEMTLDATPAQVWDVLTDYGHMSGFLSTVTSSRIVSRENGVLKVAQTGKSGVGPVSIDFSSVRLVRLAAHREIVSDVIEGDIRSSHFVTRLVPVEDGTRVLHEGRYVTSRWIPPLIGPSLIESATRKQYQELRAEILRRGR